MRMLRYVVLAILCFVSMQASAQVDPDKKPIPKNLIIAADEWCPINCSPKAERLGVGIDLAKRVFEPLGYNVVYLVMPWPEALQQAREGKIDAVVGANRNDDATLIFPENAITTISDDFYVLKGSNWQFQGEYTLKGKRLGVIEGYGYGKVVRDFIEGHKQTPDIIQIASGKDALQKNIRKLRERQIEALIESKPVMDYTIKTLQLDNEIAWAGGVPQGAVYVAFSPAQAQSKERAAQYDAVVNKFKAANVLDRIYTPYGMRP